MKKINAVFKKVSKTLRITTHSIRHTLGYHLLRSGCDIAYIQAFLGHQDISSTQIYTKVDRTDLKSVLDAYHPRSGAHKFTKIKKINAGSGDEGIDAEKS